MADTLVTYLKEIQHLQRQNTALALQIDSTDNRTTQYLCRKQLRDNDVEITKYQMLIQEIANVNGLDLIGSFNTVILWQKNNKTRRVTEYVC